MVVPSQRQRQEEFSFFTTVIRCVSAWAHQGHQDEPTQAEFLPFRCRQDMHTLAKRGGWSPPHRRGAFLFLQDHWHRLGVCQWRNTLYLLWSDLQGLALFQRKQKRSISQPPFLFDSTFFWTEWRMKDKNESVGRHNSVEGCHKDLSIPLGTWTEWKEGGIHAMKVLLLRFYGISLRDLLFQFPDFASSSFFYLSLFGLLCFFLFHLFFLPFLFAQPKGKCFFFCVSDWRVLLPPPFFFCFPNPLSSIYFFQR